MAYNLNPQELAFLQRYAEHEDIAQISHLLRAIISGVDLTKDDLLSIEDNLMDRTSDMENEGLEVPQFFGAIRSIIARLVNSQPSAPDQSRQNIIPGMVNPNQPFQQPVIPQKKARKVAK